MKIILDAGHGGIDNGLYLTAGKRSLYPVDGEWYYEGVENRKFVDQIAKALMLNGYEVEFTVHPNDSTDLSLRERVAKVNDIAKDHEAILISIHSNGHTNNSAHGHEVFTCNSCSINSHKLAEIWLKNYFKLIEQKNRGHKKANFYMVKKSHCPAILIELAFHTNEREVRLLRDWKYRLNVTIAVLNTIKEYESRKTR